MRTLALVASSALLLSTACTEEARFPTEPQSEGPSFEILDNAHN